MGATYTRQSSTEIVDGEVINAADFNNEFAQLVSFAAASTGHTHDGTTAEGGPITKLLGTSITIGDASAGTDITVTFDGETSDGVLTWMEDEDQFKFSDDIMIVDDEQLIFGSDSNVAISYDETTTDSLKIAATEGAGLAITLMADEGDDAGDEWKLNVADGGTITLGNDINSAGTYVTHLTVTPNATVANSTIAAAGNLTVGNDLTVTDDVILDSDSGVLKFGDDQEITVTHVADTGLNLKHTATGDDKPIVLTLQTGETDIALNDVIGRIDFQAPDETTGTDAILVAAGIAAVSEGDFSSSNNATKLSFRTAASEAASEKMSLSSGGNLTISGDLTVSGDDITMGTNTSGHIMVADGTNFNPVAVSGDIGISNTGAVSISTGVIVNADISSTAAIDPDKFDLTAAADGTGITIAASDLLLVADADDSNAVKKINASQLNTYVSAESSAVAADNITTGDGAVSLETSSGNVLVDSQAGSTTVDGHTGVTIQSSDSGDITLDSVADITLDAGGADIVLKDDGTTFGSITNSGGEVVIKSGSTPTTALTFAGDDANFADNVQLDSDSAELLFGDDGEIKLIHNADKGLILKHTATADDKPVSLTLQTGETALTVGEPLGTINFQAPDEAGGTDAILIAAAIEAVAEGTFAADNNATKLVFKTGASEAAAEKMSLSSVGNVTMKNTATGDDTPMVLTLQTGETDIAINDVIGQIDFQAPDEGTGTDAILVAAGIAAVSEGDFSSSNNATKLSFKTGASEAASEKMSLSSAGLLTIADDLMIKDGGTIGVASTNDAMTIASTGIVTFKDDIVIKDGGTIGTGTTPGAMTVAAGGAVTFSAVPLFPNDTVETADIQDNAVTLAKMAGLARGKIIYGDASGDPAALAVGTANQVLTSDGTDISWATSSSGISEASAIGLIIALG